MDISVASSLHDNKITADEDLREITVPEISNIIIPTLHACSSQHITHKNTWQTPLERWHGKFEHSCRTQVHRVHT